MKKKQAHRYREQSGGYKCGMRGTVKGLGRRR